MQITSFEAQSARAKNRNKNYWRELIAVWQKSNESQKDFCARMKIKVGTFAHWRGVFTKENNRSDNRFIDVRVTAPVQEKIGHVDHFTIECPSGHKITFSSKLNPEEAQPIFKLLGLIV